MPLLRKKTSLLACAAISLVALSGSISSCGKSIYETAANKETDEARKEAAIIALDKDDYETASKNMEKLWESKPSNENAQLYAISLLGLAGFSLFDVVRDALQSASSSSKESSAGNAILDKISDVVGTNVTETQLDIIRTAIDVLRAAPDQTSAGLKFQKCLTAGIYAAPTLGGLSEKIAELNTTLQALPSRLGASGTACLASLSEINAIGEALTGVISDTALLASRVKDIETIVAGCLPSGSAQAVNSLTSQVNALATNADKGCSIPSTQKIGSFTLPACMNSFVLAAGGSTAVASDKKIAGCEVFLNCTGNSSCF